MIDARNPARGRKPSVPARGGAILVDANVLLDVFTADPAWFGWSAAALTDALDRAPLVVTPIVYAEVPVRFATIGELEAELPADVYRREPLPWEAAFLAGKAFVE